MIKSGPRFEYADADPSEEEDDAVFWLVGEDVVVGMMGWNDAGACEEERCNCQLVYSDVVSGMYAHARLSVMHSQISSCLPHSVPSTQSSLFYTPYPTSKVLPFRSPKANEQFEKRQRVGVCVCIYVRQGKKKSNHTYRIQPPRTHDPLNRPRDIAPIPLQIPHDIAAVQLWKDMADLLDLRVREAKSCCRRR